MNFWDLFKNKDKTPHLNGLHKVLQKKFPETEENDLILMACLSGLLARIAYVDFEIHENERSTIISTLINWHGLNQEQAEEIAHLAIDEMKELAGLDTREYCKPLNNILSNEEKFEVIQILFKLAASDDTVDSNEAEEIRIINKSLLLEHQHFIAARAGVKEAIGSLKC